MQQKRRIGRLPSPATLALGVAVALSTLAVAPAENRQGGEALLVSCEGNYLRLLTAAPRILGQGSLWDKASMAAFRPKSGRNTDCPISDFQVDRGRNVAYVAIGREAQGDNDEQRHYRIVSFRIADMNRIAVHEIDAPVDGPVRLLLDPEHDELLVSHSHLDESGSDAGWLNVVEHFAAPGLIPIRASKDRRHATADGRLPSSAPLSSFARWAGAGRIVDQVRILDDGGRVLELLDPYALLPADVAGQLNFLERQGAAGQGYLPIAFADSADQRVLFAIGHDTGLSTGPAGSALWLYDVGKNLSLRPIVTKEPVAAYDPTRRETPTVHLSPDGNLILMERFAWRSVQGSGTSSMVRFKTGPVDVYDASSGALLRTINLDPAPGFTSRLLAISPEGNVALFGTKDLVYVVSLDGQRPPAVLKPAAGLAPFWSIAVTYEGHVGIEPSR